MMKTKQPRPPSSLIYSTSFPATENPISEGGKWINGLSVGLDWQDVRTLVGTAGAPNKAYGTGESPDAYNDNIACLLGFPANHSAQAVIYREPGYTPSDTHEVELLLRFKISAHVARGYEVDFAYGGAGVQVFCWHGPQGDVFPELTGSGPGPGGLVTGDVVKAKMIGNVLTVYKNGSLIYTVTDDTYADGGPGMGYFLRPGGTLENYCFSQYTASAE
jgi:hypothetical protein